MRIVFTSDTHGSLYPVNYAQNCPENTGLFCVAAQIKKDENTLVLDGGDSLQGTPLLSYYLGHKDEYEFNPMAEGFNAMGLDYYTLGNHDFNFGYDAILDYVTAMKAQLVSCNVVDKRGALCIKRSVVHTMPDGLRVGITGAVTGFVNVWEQKENLTELEVLDPIEELEKELSILKETCDLTVCIYHGGFEEDLSTGKLLSESRENEACRISREMDFDILLTGHQHMAVEGVMIDGTYGVQPPDKARKYCELTIDGTKGSFDISSSLKSVEAPGSEYEEIAAAHEFMNGLNATVDKWLDEPIGFLEKEIQPEEKLSAALKGSKVAAIFNQVELDFTGADFACTSLSNDPLGLKKGITVRDVLGIYQFANTIEVKSVTRAVLKQALERCAEYFDYDEETGKVSISKVFLQPKVEHYNYDFYAGLWYEFDLTRPVGDRVVTLKKIDGTELLEDAEYTLALSNYRATGTGGYECIGQRPVVRSTSEEMPDLLIDYIRKNSPVPEIINSRFSCKPQEQ
ncbi:bifunctional metallophosphatase/5'-nucleotidase [Butyrivibrio sp. CB08]|uniref:bifunctional metallophosphatase/5'-nucleotidase n=1 Tax=Butyrivibrio sp. CB08 TaxID=2364879 RepID=UPI000EA90988|nr:bifunctional UDP-sugar hydrolase/5'-nucleotidase [Butyrivibrio sp. CB08]RKM58737.1 bifunctional metallophosphatase/5'-nucleotidase [Butyrivibrio sp. CB08]